MPSPGDLPHPGIKPGSPALQANSLTSQPPGKSSGKESACKCKRLRAMSSLGQEDPLEEEIATGSSSLAWEIP